MKHKYQTQYCACREFRFQHWDFKKSKYRQRAQQLPLSLLIFSALWERGGGSESGNPRGHFGPRLNVTAKPTKLKPKLFLYPFWFSSKSCSTGIFINWVRSFFDTENKKCCSFQEFSLSPISFQSDKLAALFLVVTYGDGCLDGKKLLPLEKSWNEGCRRVFILAGNGLRWNTLDVEQIKEDHWGGIYSYQACNPMAQLLVGIYEKLLRSDEAVMRGPWCSSLREWAWKL